MGWYGTILVARPGGEWLPAYPGVREAFGSRFGGLHDLGEGWQRVVVVPFYRERPRHAAGVGQLAAATGAPVIVAAVSESWCARVDACTPDGLAIAVHLPNLRKACPYEHREGQPGPFVPRRVVAEFKAWAAAAGRSPDLAALAAALDADWPGSAPMQNRVLALFAALGFPPGREIPPLIDPHDDAFWAARQLAFQADVRAANRIAIMERGKIRGLARDLSPCELAYLRFSEQLEAAAYTGSPPRDELAAACEKLASRWNAEP
ncbi:hypothetical protein [Dactylosporangium sp. NPDC051541]|uniref:hypothetical protein n=1 Tax=Dactylosporangium sp. NPDC051541 TaxID=3363977 RepID=UPI0037890828